MHVTCILAVCQTVADESMYFVVEIHYPSKHTVRELRLATFFFRVYSNLTDRSGTYMIYNHFEYMAIVTY